VFQSCADHNGAKCPRLAARVITVFHRISPTITDVKCCVEPCAVTVKLFLSVPLKAWGSEVPCKQRLADYFIRLLSFQMNLSQKKWNTEKRVRLWVILQQWNRAMLILLKITLIGSLLHPESFEYSWYGSAKCISAALEKAIRCQATHPSCSRGNVRYSRIKPYKSWTSWSLQR
jgi:hypothetical protein